MSEASDRPRDQLLGGFIQRYGLVGLDVKDLNQALIHRSYAYEMGLNEDNERLEFLGDAIIAAITSEYLYQHDPQANEGTLSKRRAQLVSRQLLGRRAIEMGLGELMLLGRGERETGGSRRRSTLGSALEAIVGILYLRRDFAAARGFVSRHILDALLSSGATDHAHGDFKSMLQEWAQRHYKLVPVYTRLGEEGPDHDKQFFVQVEVAGHVLAQAGGVRIKAAENEAARQALEKIRAGEILPS